MGVNEVAEELKNKSDADLAQWQGENLNYPTSRLLAEYEFARRGRVKQHELNMKLIAEQERWMKSTTKVSAWVTLAAALIGATVGSLLTFWLQQTPPPTKLRLQEPQVQTESAPSTSVDRKEKAESVPSKTP